MLSDTSNVLDMFAHSRVYAKGWMVLRMLRGVVGEEAFRQILRTYADDPRYRYGNASTADFVALAEAVSGQDLAYFFRRDAFLVTARPNALGDAHGSVNTKVGLDEKVFQVIKAFGIEFALGENAGDAFGQA